MVEDTDNLHIKGANQTKKMISGESGQSSLPVQPTKGVSVYSVDCDGGVEEFCWRQVFSRVWWDGKRNLGEPFSD